jgi:hypothetical protein
MARTFAALMPLLLPAIVHGQDVAVKPIEGTIIRTLGDKTWRTRLQLRSPAFSHDDKTLAFGGTHGLGLWEAGTGKPITTFGLSGCGYYESIAWDPEGRLYAGGQHTNVMRWDAKTRKLAQEYEWHKSVITRISLSADGSRLASLCHGKKVAVWEMPAGRIVRTLELDSDANWPDAILSPDGKCLATTGKGKAAVVLFDVATGKKKAVFDDDANANFLKLAFTPDGTRLVGGEFGMTFVWDLASGKLIQRMKNVDDDHVEGLAVSPSGKLAAVVGWREAVHVWDLGTGRLLRSLVAPGDRLRGVTFSRDGATVVAGGEHETIHRPATELQPLWEQLSEFQPATAHVALWRLVASGDRAVAFLKQRLKPTAHTEPKKLRAWIDQLDSGEFAQRDLAMKALEDCGGAAEEELRAAMARAIPLEVRRRVEQLLARLGPTSENLRARRALCVLEQIASPNAAGLLELLAGGDPGDAFSDDARASLARLRHGGPPIDRP